MSIMYPSVIHPNVDSRVNEKNNPNIVSTATTYHATVIGKRPDAIGRSFLFLCCVSLSMSKISLIKYIALLIIVNSMNATVDFPSSDIASYVSDKFHLSFIVKKKAKYIKKFLVHCFGRKLKISK